MCNSKNTAGLSVNFPPTASLLKTQYIFELLFGLQEVDLVTLSYDETGYFLANVVNAVTQLTLGYKNGVAPIAHAARTFLQTSVSLGLDLSKHGPLYAEMVTLGEDSQWKTSM